MAEDKINLTKNSLMIFWDRYKMLWEKEKTSILSFFHNVLKRLLLQGHSNLGLIRFIIIPSGKILDLAKRFKVNKGNKTSENCHWKARKHVRVK